MALKRIQSFKKFNVKKVRVNLKTLYREEHFEELFLFINEVNNLNTDIEWYFDIGIPGDTLRFVIPKPPYYIQIKSGQKVQINFDDEKDLYLRKPNLSIPNDKIFYEGLHLLYEDGEIEFERIQRLRLRCFQTSQNRTARFIYPAPEIYFAKAIHCSSLKVSNLVMSQPLLNKVKLNQPDSPSSPVISED
ncbi:hypothetical protein [Bacillus sp. J14TS2]|uniref:hypothetical protein n=1 Tax=Bacillus sp. J14TS2 TaxID=2807188 RepID=UPI001BB31807|nr:hypothetical protein [Bacillus sp. J14TS2]